MFIGRVYNTHEGWYAIKQTKTNLNIESKLVDFSLIYLFIMN